MRCVPDSNLTRCGMGMFEGLAYDMKSSTPIGISLGSLLAIGVLVILIYVLFLYKIGYFEDKTKDDVNHAVRETEEKK